MYEVASSAGDSAKLTLKDVELEELAFSQMAAAMATAPLDAAMEVAPFTERMIETEDRRAVDHPTIISGRCR